LNEEKAMASAMNHSSTEHPITLLAIGNFCVVGREKLADETFKKVVFAAT
jgi:hypothetical protein